MTTQPAQADLNAQVARRLGWTQCGRRVGRPPDSEKWPGCEMGMRSFPNWTTSRDAAHELLAGMTDEQWKGIEMELANALILPEHGAHGDIRAILTATPEQICKAFLKATEPRE